LSTAKITGLGACERQTKVALVTSKGIPTCRPARKKILACTLVLATTLSYVAPQAFAYNYNQAQKTYVPPSTYPRENELASVDGIASSLALTASAPSPQIVQSSREGAGDPGAYHIHLKVEQLEKRGALDEAAHVLTNGLKMYPRDYTLLSDLVNLNIKRVKKLALHRDYASAAELVRQDIYMNPGNPKLSELLDDVLRESGVNPQDPNERTKIANLLLSERKLNDAKVEYEASLKLKPTPQAYVGLGLDQMREGVRKQAKNDFEKALELDSAYAPAHKEMGLLYGASGDLIGASAELSRAAILNPADKSADNALIDLWQRQVNRNFNDVTSHFGLARAYVLAGDLKAAQSEYRQIVTMDPNNPNLPEARLNFKLALAHQEAASLLASARALEAQGQLSAAMQKTMEGLHVDPSNVNLLIYKAYLLDRSGQYSPARYGYLAVLKQDPNNAYARQRLQVLASATTAAAYAAMPGTNGLPLRGYSQPYPGAVEAPPQPIQPPPPPQFDHVANLSDLFWQIRGAAADDTIAVQKKEDTLMNMQNMYMSLKKQGIDPMQMLSQLSASGADPSAIMSMMGGAGGSSASAAATPAPPGIPADIAAIVNGSAGHGSSSLGPPPPGLPPDIAAIVGGSSASSSPAPAAPTGLPPGAQAMISSLGLAKPDGSLDMAKISSYLAGAPLPPNLAAIVDSLGLRKPDGTLDLAKIMNLIGGGGGLAALTGGAVPAVTTAIPRAKASQPSGGSSAGLPPDIAALLNNSGTPPVVSTVVKAKTPSKAKTKVAPKKTTKTNAKAKKSVHGQIASQAPKSQATAPAGLPGGMNLASFMPVIQMAMQRFIDLENKTNKIGDQLSSTQQSVRELQHYITSGGKLPPPLPQASEPINTSIQSTSAPSLSSGAIELPAELRAPAPPAPLSSSAGAQIPADISNAINNQTGIQSSVPPGMPMASGAPPGIPADIVNAINHQSSQAGSAPSMTPPGMPMAPGAPPGIPADILNAINHQSNQSGQAPPVVPPGMPMPTSPSSMIVPGSTPPDMPMPTSSPNAQPSLAADPASSELVAKLAPPITPGSTRIQPNSPQLDWNSPPIPSTASLPSAATTPAANQVAPQAPSPTSASGSNLAAALPDKALVASAQVNVQNAAIPAVPPTNVVPQANAVPPATISGVPVFSDPGGSPDDAVTSKKEAHQHKVRVEIEGVRPDILGIRVKFVIINDQGYSIPLPDNMNNLLKRVKVFMPADADKVPPHGEVHGSVRVPIP
jgi:tetratricopeptide (TPR) repeat protein